MNARPGYWDIEACTWVGAEPTHIVPPVPALARSAADAGDTHVDTDTDTEPAAVPTPRTRAEPVTSVRVVVADATAG